MNKLIYTRPDDGGVTIIIPASKSDLEKTRGPLSEAQYEAIVRGKSIPANAINVMEIIDVDIPDREFRDAWKQNGSAITHDLEKAKNIQLEKIRAAREPKLVALDKEFMLALERGQSTTAIVAQKQALRDITEGLKNLDVKSIDDIKAAFPEELRGVN
jgi:hypothetical protein